METEKQVLELKLEDVLPNRFQPRIKFSEESINELANSIKEHGVIQPIVVRRIGDKYEIIAGERRYKASLKAGKETIPAIITNLSDGDSAEIALLENIQRENLTPIEEAISYKKILDMGYTQEQLAKKIGNKQSTIANKVRLLNLTDEVQEALLENKISERHARSLLKIIDKDMQVQMLEKIIEGRFTVRKTDEEIDKLLKGEKYMNENNEIKTTIPTAKIYEETESKPVAEPINISAQNEPVQIYKQPEPVVQVPLEPIEKVEPVTPIQEQPVEKTEPFQEKFLQPETFTNIPMHNIPEERPMPQNGEFASGKFFEIPTVKEEPIAQQPETFNQVFGDTNNPPVESTVSEPQQPVIEKEKTPMPVFDFSNTNTQNKDDSMNFGEATPAVGQSIIAPLTEVPTYMGNITEPISQPEMSFEEIMTPTVSTENNVGPVIDAMGNIEFNQNSNQQLPTESVVSPTTIQPIETPSIVTPVQSEFVAPVTPIEETVAEVQSIEPVITPDVNSALSNNITENPIVQPNMTIGPAQNAITEMKIEETPTIQEYNIPTFDPEVGTSTSVVNDEIVPLEQKDSISQNQQESIFQPIVEPDTPVIKIPFDLITVKNEMENFTTILKNKGFKIKSEEMDFENTYQITLTIEK